MKRSVNRILTTHVGSLPRPDDLRALILRKQQGEAVDEAAFAARVKSAVAEVVRRQGEAGIDIIADGEMGRIGFIPYVNERLAGIAPSATAESANYWGLSREYQAFPEFYAWAAGMPGTAGQTGRTRWVCTGPVSYKGLAALQQDIATLKSALAGVPHEDAFMPAVSPANLRGAPERRLGQARRARRRRAAGERGVVEEGGVKAFPLSLEGHGERRRPTSF
jgi:5-methyltetrahydropteroyltriglutamate--homocysteine methyltransferase